MALRDMAIADGATAGYRFAEASGTYTDELGGTAGTATGAVTRITGSPTGPGVKFGGTTSDGIDVPDQDVLDMADNYSIEMLFRRDDIVGEHVPLAKGAGAYGVAFITDTDADNPAALALNEPGFGKLVAYTAGSTDKAVWHHAVITRSAAGTGNTLIYVDGVEGHDEIFPSETMADNASVLNIGRESGWRGFTGALAELWLYRSVVLTAAQVAAHYAAAMVPRVTSPDYSAFPKAKLRRVA